MPAPLSVPRRLLASLLLALGSLLAAGCASLPPPQGRVDSNAFADTASTRFGREVAPQLAAHPGLSGIHAMPVPYDAFAARIALDRPPGTLIGCALNAASLQAGNFAFFPLGSIAPGEIVSVYGTGLDGARVLVEGLAAPILYSSDTQVNAGAKLGARGPAQQQYGVADLLARMPQANAEELKAKRLVLQVNGGVVGFDTPLRDGDTVIIRWEDPGSREQETRA